MKFIAILALLIAGCSTFMLQQDQALTFRRMYSKSILRVEEPGSVGSGFVIILHGQKVLVTNAHVCGTPPFHMQASSDQTHEKYPLTPVAITERYDLCITDITGAEAIPPLALAKADPEVGATVYTLGFPLGRYLRYMDGQIERYMFKWEPPSMATNIWVVPGQSGSPVLNKNGEVVGVVYAVDNKDPHTGYVIPVSVLKALVKVLEQELNKTDKSPGN